MLSDGSVRKRFVRIVSKNFGFMRFVLCVLVYGVVRVFFGVEKSGLVGRFICVVDFF